MAVFVSQHYLLFSFHGLPSVLDPPWYVAIAIEFGILLFPSLNFDYPFLTRRASFAMDVSKYPQNPPHLPIHDAIFLACFSLC
jgi:hypothetical protein